MKIAESWLREWVNPAVSTTELGEMLSLAGLEVDSVEAVAPHFSGVLVGEVLEVRKHPDADKLNLTLVNVGQGEPLAIVCGASNVRAPMKVACAIVGAILPGDFQIKKAKLRGEVSLGMLCSAKELGLSEESQGIMDLPADAPVGMDIRQYLNLNDQVLEVDLTPNRSDCLSVQGIAREVATMTGTPLTPVVHQAWLATSHNQFAVRVAATEACPLYLGCVVENYHHQAPTPQWMQRKLIRSGLRPKSLTVDITNYVMLELGQPMHAFDLDKLQGGIQVRHAQPDEKLTLLDGKSIRLTEDVLVIADDQGAVAMAGIMGGEDSAVSETTQRLFFEAAHFTPAAIVGRARRYGLHTDSSHRFERGVDPLLPYKAMERAVGLLLEIAGGNAGPLVESKSQALLGQRDAIVFRRSQIIRLLGTTLDDTQVETYLSRLGCQLQPLPEGWLVTPPSYRFDLNIEADFVEELGRLIGYANLPAAPVGAPMHLPKHTEHRRRDMVLKTRLVDRGYHEVVTYAFVNEGKAKVIAPQAQSIALANPLSEDLKVMRPSHWVGLLSTIEYNLKRQQNRLRFFETGLCFLQGETLEQIPKIAGAITGSYMAEQWADGGRKVDFYDLKADVEALLVGSPHDYRFVAAQHPALHPGQSAQVLQNGQAIGWLGLIHPQVQKAFDIAQPVYVFELELHRLLDQEVPRYQAFSKFPEMRRDLAFVMPKTLEAQQIMDAIAQLNLEGLTHTNIFDIFTGESLPAGHQSLALSLSFQKLDGTLTDVEIDNQVNRIVAHLTQTFNIHLR